jgi:hypothetical protein
MGTIFMQISTDRMGILPNLRSTAATKGSSSPNSYSKNRSWIQSGHPYKTQSIWSNNITAPASQKVAPLWQNSKFVWILVSLRVICQALFQIKMDAFLLACMHHRGHILAHAVLKGEAHTPLDASNENVSNGRAGDQEGVGRWTVCGPARCASAAESEGDDERQREVSPDVQPHRGAPCVHLDPPSPRLLGRPTGGNRGRGCLTGIRPRRGLFEPACRCK